MTPTLYFDLGSPYAYLGFERAEDVPGAEPELEPVLLGAIMKWRGRGSWSQTPQRDAGIAEIDRRAERYGLPAIAWHAHWPINTLSAMRAATWAKREGRVREFATVAFRAHFANGEDLADLAVLAACAERAGLDGGAMVEAIATPELKDALKQVTQAAWDAGVRGVPTLRIGDALFFGDDQLEAAAAQMA
jgi:2-hydroxychromene-2-carboxylate isomerase